MDLKPHNFVSGSAFSEEPVNRVTQFAQRYLDKDASMLIGSGWERVKDAAKQSVIAIGVIAAALYFYEHSRWHEPKLVVMEPLPKVKSWEEQQKAWREDFVEATADGVAKGIERSQGGNPRD